MHKITVLGTGLVGKAIALDLAQRYDVTAVDSNSQALAELQIVKGSINPVLADLSEQSSIINNIKDADVVVSAVPGHMGYRTLETVICSNKNIVDIAFFPEDALTLDALAKKHNVTAIVDMGVAPGLSNLVLGRHSVDMDIHEFKCMVGGLPKHPEPPFNYKAPFSPVDVIEEYTRPARLVRNGKLVTMPALSEIENVTFDHVGTLEAFNTDGLRTLINSFPSIQNMVEKTLRYPGHATLISMLKEIGFLDSQPINLSSKAIAPLQLSTELFKKHWKLGKSEPEFTVMRINLSGKSKATNVPVNHRYDLYDEYDCQTGVSSMARTTGYTCTAAVDLLIEIGQVPSCFQYILKHYKDRGIQLIHDVA